MAEPLILLLATAADAADAATAADAAESSGLSFVQAGLVIFFLVFVGIVAWVLMGRSSRFEKHARIPLEDEPVEPIEPSNRGGA